MFKFYALLKLNFNAVLASMSVGRKKTKAFSGIGALALMCFLFFFISLSQCFSFGMIMAEAGHIEMLPVFMSLFSSAFCLLFSFSAASGLIFGSKDTDLLIALPVSSFYVMLSKVLSLYLENLMLSVSMMIPAVAAFAIYGGNINALSVFFIILMFVFLPLLPTLLAVILGYIISLLMSKTEKKALVGNLVSFLMMGVMLFAFIQLNRLSMVIITNIAAVEKLISTWLFPFKLISEVFDSHYLSLLWYALISLVPFLLMIWVLSINYKKIVTGMNAKSSKNDYKLGEMNIAGKSSALLKKEITKYFNTPIYLLNTIFGALILLGIGIAAIIKKDVLAEYIFELESFGFPILPVITAALASAAGTICTTSVSISLEKDTLWVLKEAPVTAMSIFRAKILMNLIVSVPPVVVSAFLISLAAELPVIQTTSISFFCVIFCVFIAVFGIVLNLRFPKFDAEESAIVKQSASAFFGMFSGFVLVIIFVGLYILLSPHISYPYFYCLIMLLLVAGILFQIHYLKTKGERKFKAL